MFTHRYNGLYIHGYFDKPECHVTGSRTLDRMFKSYRAAQIAVTKARRAGVPPMY
jgi:hypothetical protein